jgi:hypothetical protein
MLILSTDKIVYRPDETVKINLLWKNDSPLLLETSFASSQRFDICAERHGGKVWQWSDGLYFAQVFTTLVILPGDSRVFTAEWNGRDRRGLRVPPGRYRLKAWILNADEQAEATVEFVPLHRWELKTESPTC